MTPPTHITSLVEREEVELKFSAPHKPGVNFTNILREAFTLVDPKSVKKLQLSPQYLFTLSGSENVKAVHRSLMKLSPGFGFVLVELYQLVSFAV